ncbi:hypothetical protein [Halobaculum sp. MBLA0143]|uniref:hypothetical protein n=1 Tax=Halobaculum sp. MBLA0143 TaxID=3079933 RepID=UPI003525B4A0
MSRERSRRRFLAGASTATVAALAGCSGILNSAVSSIFEDVNVVNNAGEPISGTITVTDPNDETVLEETFDLVSEDGAETETESGAVRYDDVFTTTGSYTVSITLDEDSAVQGVRESEETVEVADTDNTNVIVAIGETEEASGPINVAVIDTDGDTDTSTG